MDWFGPAVAVRRSALDEMVRSAAASSDGTETGGFLFGAEDAKYGSQNVVIVCHAGDAGPGASRRRDFFRPDVVHAQHLALDAFTADGSQWIGTWHTHLRWRSGRPSSSDLTTYRSHLREPALGFSRFVCIILTPTLRIWPAGLCWEQLHCHAWVVGERSLFSADVVVVTDEESICS
ncbi:MAG: Mov34/MPN/PAD-1 family protein [Chloroflexota bacterium]